MSKARWLKSLHAIKNPFSARTTGHLLDRQTGLRRSVLPAKKRGYRRTTVLYEQARRDGTGGEVCRLCGVALRRLVAHVGVHGLRPLDYQRKTGHRILKGADRVCEVCRTPFYARPNTVRRTCSHACQGKLPEMKLRLAQLSERRSMVSLQARSRICAGCGQPFVCWRATRPVKTCSPTCRNRVFSTVGFKQSTAREMGKRAARKRWGVNAG